MSPFRSYHPYRIRPYLVVTRMMNITSLNLAGGIYRSLLPVPDLVQQVRPLGLPPARTQHSLLQIFTLRRSLAYWNHGSSPTRREFCGGLGGLEHGRASERTVLLRVPG